MLGLNERPQAELTPQLVLRLLRAALGVDGHTQVVAGGRQRPGNARWKPLEAPKCLMYGCQNSCHSSNHPCHLARLSLLLFTPLSHLLPADTTPPWCNIPWSHLDTMPVLTKPAVGGCTPFDWWS